MRVACRVIRRAPGRIEQQRKKKRNHDRNSRYRNSGLRLRRITAAIYTARAGLKPLVLEGHEPGGQLSITTLVENFPGWPEGIQGPELIDNMKKQAARFGAEFQLAHLVSVDLHAHPFKLQTSSGRNSHAHADHCLRCQRAMAGPPERAGADRPRCVELRHLRRVLLPRDGDCGDRRRRLGHGGGVVSHPLCHQGHLLHRRDSFRASKIMLERAMAHPNIELRTNTVVEEVLGVEENEVKGSAPARRDQRRAAACCRCDGMFLGIGHEPNAEDVRRADRPGRRRATSRRATTSSPRATACWFRACMPAATCRTGAIARRSQRRARDAWRRSRWRNISKSTGADTGLLMPDGPYRRCGWRLYLCPECAQ